ncbi:DNA polymerase Y family protein [Glaciecola sp. XM2]|uniref:Y-family DNA polymerase n=1 Tax=Glaciecola sp. XM2 TaxID=1914931 RepID=UPI001BDECED1|nr:DNA polymerase Y family protein [Glaciecola sp. XM2]MBT1451917.1 DNA polymerase Y family protein [Glaciecola sp. XM2]
MQFDTCSLWIYLHFTQLHLNVIENTQVHDERELAQPRAIYNMQSNQLVQLNESALQKGIKHGMGLASASLLYPQLNVHEYNEEIEKHALEHMANALYLLSSDIVLMPPNGLVLRAQNMLKLYGGLGPYWQNISRCLSQLGYRYQSAAGFSIQACKVMAKCKQGIISQERDVIEQQLFKCSLAHCDIDLKDFEKLKRIGISTVDELSRVPLSQLANRISRYSVGIIAELRGQAPSKVTFFAPSISYEDYIELLYDISLVDKLVPVLKHALKKLETFLYVRNTQCLHIDVSFYQREHEPLQIGFDSAMAIYRHQDWLEIASLKLEQVRFASPVYALKLVCEKYEVAHASVDDFFTHKSTHIETMSLTSRLASKLGQQKITRLNFIDDFRPEKSTLALADIKSKSLNHAQSVFADRPGFLLETPTLLQQKIQLIKGPERMICGWWDDGVVTRDYYIGQSQQGQQMWVFKTPEKDWYLHGYFI